VIDLEFEDALPHAVLEEEWLETNGIGGYASSTICGANTRRYHGLLVAATEPPVGRCVLLSKIEETIRSANGQYSLSTNIWPDTIDPKGFTHLKRFRLDPFPVWDFVAGGLCIERTLFMIHGSNAVALRWRIADQSESDREDKELVIRPLVAFRDFHHLCDGETEFFVEINNESASVSTNAMPRLYFSHNASQCEQTGFWYRRFEYPIEAERGFDHTEDLYQPFELRFSLSKPAILIASTEALPLTNFETLRRSEVKRRARLVALAEAKDKLSRQLVLAADQFIVKRGRGCSIIAGYHWFSDWGRDTMIALPGLALATRRYEVAKQILKEYSEHISEGMIPNRFPDDGVNPEYNTVDATLWFFNAIRAYYQVTGDERFVQDEMYGHLVDIIRWHVRGTRFGIRVDTDGLLIAGEPGSQLTWMDAKFDDVAFTPRIGKPVEIQALWFNALKIVSEFAARNGDADNSRRFSEMAAMAKDSFVGQFWNPLEDCLYDVVGSDEKDGSVRPNQIFAVSLPNSMLNKEMASKVIKKVSDELLTPFGLRSLSPRDPRYRGKYVGSAYERDSAYHQGTVWVWLLGHFWEAVRKIHPEMARSRRFKSRLLGGIEKHLSEALVGQIAEIFDGDAPHRPRGAAAQAWSVAEILRIVKYERIFGKKQGLP
jgi:predicted glycogen debranching enzyme